jgi:putative addiction module component (TIGR02574 family)
VPKPVPLPPPGFDDLSVDEKIDYLQSLWDRIAATPETIPVPDWHREIIEERVKELDVNPDAGDDWDVVQERLHKKFGDRR